MSQQVQARITTPYAPRVQRLTAPKGAVKIRWPVLRSKDLYRIGVLSTVSAPHEPMNPPEPL